MVYLIPKQKLIDLQLQICKKNVWFIQEFIAEFNKPKNIKKYGFYLLTDLREKSFTGIWDNNSIYSYKLIRKLNKLVELEEQQ